MAAALLLGTAACSDGDPPAAGPTASVAAGARDTTTTVPAPPTTAAAPPPAATVEEEVEAAYLRSWAVYADAAFRLDPSRLDEVFADPALDVRHREVAELAAAGTPARMQVDHDYEVVVVNATAALVLEAHVNHSVLLDASTMQPVEPDPNTTVHREYVLQKGPDGWRVARVNAAS